MVIRKCNEDFFDLDFQIVMQSIPNNYNWNRDCKEFKDIFRTTFDKFKPKGFSFCEDSTQALTTKILTKDMALTSLLQHMMKMAISISCTIKKILIMLITKIMNGLKEKI